LKPFSQAAVPYTEKMYFRKFGVKILHK